MEMLQIRDLRAGDDVWVIHGCVGKALAKVSEATSTTLVVNGEQFCRFTGDSINSIWRSIQPAYAVKNDAPRS